MEIFVNLMALRSVILTIVYVITAIVFGVYTIAKREEK